MTGDGLADVEKELTRALDGLPGALREPCRRIAAAGGHRLRAGLVLAVAGRAWPGTSRRTAVAAASVELLHLATLVHDDAAPHDGGPTISAKEGPAVALLVGNVLTGLAFRLAADAGAGTLLAEAVVSLAADRLPAEPAAPSRNRLLAEPAVPGGTSVVGQAAADRPSAEPGGLAAAGRAAELFGVAARLGAIVTGAPEDGLHDFGRAYGTAVLLDAVPGNRVLIDELVERAAAARPDLADLAWRCRDAQLASSRHRWLLSS
jgi:hypothetical protein